MRSPGACYGQFIVVAGKFLSAYVKRKQKEYLVCDDSSTALDQFKERALGYWEKVIKERPQHSSLSPSAGLQTG